MMRPKGLKFIFFAHKGFRFSQSNMQVSCLFHNFPEPLPLSIMQTSPDLRSIFSNTKASRSVSSSCSLRFTYSFSLPDRFRFRCHFHFQAPDPLPECFPATIRLCDADTVSANGSAPVFLPVKETETVLLIPINFCEIPPDCCLFQAKHTLAQLPQICLKYMRCPTEPVFNT